MEEAVYHLPEKAPVRVLITGSRDWDDYQGMYEILEKVYASLKDRDPVLVHGAARGADTAAASIWSRLGGKTEAHPADWEQYGKRAGFVRNSEMVKLGAVLCVAFIRNGSKGATMCAGLAEKAGIPTHRVNLP